MADRIEKWTSKLSGENRKRLYEIQKPFMVKKEAEATNELVMIEKQTKIIIQGEPVFLQHFYMAFAKQIYKLKNKFTGKALINELMILNQIWNSRGLKEEVLNKIKFLYVQPYKKVYELWAHFDLGKFDVNTFR